MGNETEKNKAVLLLLKSKTALLYNNHENKQDYASK